MKSKPLADNLWAVASVVVTASVALQQKPLICHVHDQLISLAALGNVCFFIH